MKKAQASIERVVGKAGGVEADGTPVGITKTAYDKVRELVQEQLQVVRRRKAEIEEEENFLMEKLRLMTPKSGMED
jgi:hypothetical protein